MARAVTAKELAGWLQIIVYGSAGSLPLCVVFMGALEVDHKCICAYIMRCFCTKDRLLCIIYECPGFWTLLQQVRVCSKHICHYYIYAIERARLVRCRSAGPFAVPLGYRHGRRPYGLQVPPRPRDSSRTSTNVNIESKGVGQDGKAKQRQHLLAT